MGGITKEPFEESYTKANIRKMGGVRNMEERKRKRKKGYRKEEEAKY